MSKMVPVVLLAVVLVGGCVVTPAGHRGAGSVGISGSISVVVPALPTIVVLEREPYYYQGGYFYFYHDNRWSYSRSKGGPWQDLPPGHYPKEVKFKEYQDDHGKSRGHD